jgi:hypothetical protein
LRRVFKAWQSQLPNLPKTIQNCKDIILFLDVLEEHSDLLLEEWNFRNMVSQQLQDLLHLQKNYWKQRGTIKWVKFGDECTRFFHANVSIKHNRNTITSIRSTDGSVLTNHEDKALFIWHSFKERLGIFEFSGMNIDLATLITSA